MKRKTPLASAIFLNVLPPAPKSRKSTVPPPFGLPLASRTIPSTAPVCGGFCWAIRCCCCCRERWRGAGGAMSKETDRKKHATGFKVTLLRKLEDAYVIPSLAQQID